MIRHLAPCSVIAALTLASPPPARADGPTIKYDTVDAIEVRNNVITVTGIISGQGSPSEVLYTIYNSDVAAARCDRLALLATAKPGKYQFALVLLSFSEYSCKLIVRTP